jgi:hypothetical protein
MRIKNNDGDKRIRRGFLFVPKTIGGKRRWLEFASWRQSYFGPWQSWLDIEWMD